MYGVIIHIKNIRLLLYNYSLIIYAFKSLWFNYFLISKI